MAACSVPSTPPPGAPGSSSSPSATPPPRKRNLTNAQRREICLEKQRSPQVTQTQLALWAQKQFNLSQPPTQATISNILAKKTHYLETSESDLNIKRRRTVFNQALDDALLTYIQRRRERGKSMPSTSRLKEKGRHYAKKLQLDPAKVPEFSNSWVASFQKRNRLEKKFRHKRQRHDDEKKSRKSKSRSSKSRSSSKTKRHCNNSSTAMRMPTVTEVVGRPAGHPPPQIGIGDFALDLVPNLSSHLSSPLHMGYHI